MLYVPRASSFISAQIFVLNLVSWFGVQSNKFIIFLFLLLYYYTNLRPSIIFCLSYGDICLSLGISLSCSFVTVSELFCGKGFETFVISSAILLPIKLPVASIAFWITLFEVVLSAYVADCQAWSRSFWLYLLLSFYLYFYPYFYPYF